MVISTSCREISALVPGAPHSPSSSLTLLSARLFLSSFSHCPLLKLLHRFLYLFANTLSTEAPSASLMRSALASGRSVLELVGFQKHLLKIVCSLYIDFLQRSSPESVVKLALMLSAKQISVT